MVFSKDLGLFKDLVGFSGSWSVFLGLGLVGFQDLGGFFRVWIGLFSLVSDCDIKM